MNYPELNLLSTLPGRKKLQFLTALSVYERVFMHVCMAAICAFMIFCCEPFLVPFAPFTVLSGCLCVCVYSVQLDSSRIYVYSMCFCNYKGIFHSVMLINLISKSRNMKQELRKQTSTVAGCVPAYFQPFFFPPQLFSLSNSKTF